jgi:hypothetical protein
MYAMSLAIASACRPGRAGTSKCLTAGGAAEGAATMATRRPMPSPARHWWW